MQALGAPPVAAPLEQQGPGRAQDEQRDIPSDLHQVVEEVQAFVVGPVQVFELEDERATFLGTEPAEQLRRDVKGAIANLFRIVQDAAEVTARRPFDADQVAQNVGVAFGEIQSVLREEQRDDARFHLLACDVDAFVVGNLETPYQDVAQETEGLVLGLRRGATAKEMEALRTRLSPRLEFAEQPALADAGIRDNGDHG